MTKPLAPTKLSKSSRDPVSYPLEICWVKSVTPNVEKYKIRWKSINEANEETKTDEDTINKTDENLMYFKFPQERVQEGTSYKVNVYAIADSSQEIENQPVIFNQESKELHGKFFIKNSTEIELHNEEQKQP